MSVKAKFQCTAAEPIEGGGKAIVLRAVIGGSDENKEWSTYTPSGVINMNISNPAAAEQFEQGKQYYLTFEAAE